MVYIIILNWNGWKDTIDCVESCLKLTYPYFCILIVDNGSTDQSVTILREHFSDISIIQCAENLGFAGGNNVGMKHAMEQGADYIWLMNNDTIVDSEALSELVKVAESDQKIGIVGPKIYYYARPREIWFAGGILKATKSYAIHRGYRKEDVGQFQKTDEVDFITGCSLLVKAAVIEQIGFMKEDYFLYWEDVDWNVTAKKHGWHVFFTPRSHIWHKVSMSTTDLSYMQSYYWIRNGFLFLRRHDPQYLTTFLKDMLLLTFSTLRTKQIQRTWGYIIGIKDFFLNQYGRKRQTFT